MYVFPLTLYRLAVLPLLKARRLALQRFLSRLLWRGARPTVRRQVCIQRTRNGGLGMPDLESHWLAERLAHLGRSLTGDERRVGPFLASSQTQRLGETLFVRECRTALRNLLGTSDLSRPRKELYRELVVGSASDPLSKRRGWRGGGDPLSLELGARIELLEQLRVLAHLATCSECVTPSRLELPSGPGRHARLRSLRQWFGRNG